MREVDNVMEQCYDCDNYKYIPAKMYLANGDPGYPEEHKCDKDWLCPFVAKHDDEDGFTVCDGCSERNDDECEKCYQELIAEEEDETQW
jgi:hypothetical protein